MSFDFIDFHEHALLKAACDALNAATNRDFLAKGTLAVLCGLLGVLAVKMVSNGVDVSGQSSNLGLIYVVGAFIAALVATFTFLLCVLELPIFHH